MSKREDRYDAPMAKPPQHSAEYLKGLADGRAQAAAERTAANVATRHAPSEPTKRTEQYIADLIAGRAPKEDAKEEGKEEAARRARDEANRATMRATAPAIQTPTAPAARGDTNDMGKEDAAKALYRAQASLPPWERGQ